MNRTVFSQVISKRECYSSNFNRAFSTLVHLYQGLALDDVYKQANSTKYQADRGHLANRSSFASSSDQAGTFHYLNIVPQNPQSNQGNWALTEKVNYFSHPLLSISTLYFFLELNILTNLTIEYFGIICRTSRFMLMQQK